MRGKIKKERRLRLIQITSKSDFFCTYCNVFSFVSPLIWLVSMLLLMKNHMIMCCMSRIFLPYLIFFSLPPFLFYQPHHSTFPLSSPFQFFPSFLFWFPFHSPLLHPSRRVTELERASEDLRCQLVETQRTLDSLSDSHIAVSRMLIKICYLIISLYHIRLCERSVLHILDGVYSTLSLSHFPFPNIFYMANFTFYTDHHFF